MGTQALCSVAHPGTTRGLGLGGERAQRTRHRFVLCGQTIQLLSQRVSRESGYIVLQHVCRAFDLLFESLGRFNEYNRRLLAV